MAEATSSSNNNSHHRRLHHKQEDDEKGGDEAGSWLQLGLATQPDYESTTAMMVTRLPPSTSYAPGLTHLDLHLAPAPAADNNHNHATAIPTFLSPATNLHHHHHHHHQTLLPTGAPSLSVSSSSSASFMQSFPTAPTSDFRIVHPPPRRPHSGLWFMLQASQHQYITSL